MANAEQSECLPIDELRHFVTAHLTVIIATPAIPAILFSRELHAENEPLRQFFAKLIATRHQHFSRLIQKEIDVGHFRSNLEAVDAGYLILTLIQGLAMRWSLNAQNFDLVNEGSRLLEVLLDGFISG